MGMKQILVMMAAMVLMGCSKDTLETSQAAEAEAQVAPAPEPTPVSPADEKLIVEKAARKSLNKPEGELTMADLENVTALGLGGTKITDAGLKDVAKVQQLRYLYLFDTKITDAGLKEIAKLQELGGLYLADIKVAKAGVAELKKALPNCLISGP